MQDAIRYCELPGNINDTQHRMRLGPLFAGDKQPAFLFTVIENLHIQMIEVMDPDILYFFFQIPADAVHCLDPAGTDQQDIASFQILRYDIHPVGKRISSRYGNFHFVIHQGSSRTVPVSIMDFIADSGQHIDFRAQTGKNTADIGRCVLKRNDLDLQLRPLFIDPNPVIRDQIGTGDRRSCDSQDIVFVISTAAGSGNAFLGIFQQQFSVRVQRMSGCCQQHAAAGALKKHCSGFLFQGVDLLDDR